MQTMKTYVLRMAGLASLGGLLLGAPLGAVQAAGKPAAGIASQDAWRTRDGEVYSGRFERMQTTDQPAVVFDLPEGRLSMLIQDGGEFWTLESTRGRIGSTFVDVAATRAKNDPAPGDGQHEVRCIRCYTDRRIGQSWGFYAVYRDGVLLGYLIIQPDGTIEFKPNRDTR